MLKLCLLSRARAGYELLWLDKLKIGSRDKVMTSETPEKGTRAEASILQAERNETEVALNFGMQFARNHR